MTRRHPHLVEQDRIARERRRLSREALDLDVPTFVAQVKALPVFKDCPRSIRHTKVVFVHTAFASGGRAHGNRMARIRASFAPPLDPTGQDLRQISQERLAWVLEAIVHELVHCALPRGVVHNERFRRTLARAALELWGIEVDPNPGGFGRPGRYELDANIERILELRLAAGTLEYPRRRPEEAPPKPPRTELVAKLVEKRTAHAIKMFERAEKRARAAQKTLTKWRAKVRYYERQAAKRAKP